MSAQVFRKRPVEVEVWQTGPESAHDVLLWIRQNGGRGNLAHDGGLSIETLEGTMYADPGDFIIRGVQGEFYPCKPDIFATTYEPATDRPATNGDAS